MRKFGILLIGLIAAGMTVAAGQTTTSQIETRVDYSRFKTYEWNRSSNSEYGTSSADANVIEALESELARKGLSKSSNAPDLSICYHSYFGSEELNRYTMTEGAATYAWTIKKGEVAIDIFDSATDKEVWRNAAKINPKARSQDGA